MQQNPWLRKSLAVGIILLFVGTGIIPAIAQVTKKPSPTARGIWLYVGGSGPGNYSRIQDAIDNASDEDTVFVYDDSSPYYENLVVNKSVTLSGENKETTIIDGEKKDDVLRITANQVTLTGFTIQNCSFDWEIYDQTVYFGINVTSNSNTIRNNIIKNNFNGIICIQSSYNSIFDNVFQNNYHYDAPSAFALILYKFSNNNSICSNTFTKNEGGCRIVYNSTNNHVCRNTFVDNEFSIRLVLNCSYNTIARNLIYNVTYEGIEIDGCCNNTIFRNIIKNGCIVCLCFSDCNIISGNLLSKFFLHNSKNNQIFRNIIRGYNGITVQCCYCNNTWDDGKVGNYWVDFKHCYPDAKRKIPRFWIWNTPYEKIGDGHNIDRYPIVGTPITIMLFINELFNQSENEL
jgi:parallel beta-helix repeat protein